MKTRTRAAAALLSATGLLFSTGVAAIILGSDRNTGLWIFTFTCESEVLVPDTETGELVDSGLYCRKVQP